MPCDKKELLEFVSRWQGRGYEKGDTQQFWLQLLRTIGYSKVDDVLFEFHVSSGGFIDVWIPDAGVLIEQKALGINLDKEELRQGKQKTPLTQALDYVDELPRLEQPRFVITCNFSTFRVYDRDAYGRSQLPNNAFEFTLDELANHPEYLAFINDPTNSRLEKEKTVSIKAGELIGKLYDKLREGYIDPASEESMHALNVLCVRLVFCLYCEDAGLFGKDAFYNYLKDVPANRIRTTLKNLFHALDTNLSERDPYDLEVKAFPYVNGGLFRDESEVPNFTDETKSFLLDEVSSHIDWSQISPTIFGGIFESTLNPETRRSGGMHYTSPENIHKVIDPLFLDDLKEELKSICTEEGTTPRKRENALKHFHEKICSLTFFDPACGSGNFLTETYICLRKLEDTVLNELRKGQTGLSLGDEEEAGKRVSLNQFYGIEINDFAVTVAETALWISRLKANGETSMFYDAGGDDFPLSEKAHIVEGNALRIDWNRVLPASECNYIMGNPPFVGYSNHSAEQQKDRASLFGKVKTVDYVACWYKKAADYISNFPIHCAFVSTNSICQGQQVQPIWEPLFQSGIHIDFAWQTFIWSSEAALQAHVYVVIVGFSRFGNERRILFLKDGQKLTVENINGYLQNGSEIFIEKRNKPLCSVPLMIAGGKPTDGGNLILSLDEKSELVLQEPSAAKWIRPYSMGDEFINKKERFCLWLVGISLSELENLTLVQKRVESVRNMRLMSSKIATQKKALTPWLFDEVKPPKSNFIGIPAVTSSRRKYVPFDFVTNGMIPGNQLYFVETESLYYFGILVSQFHNAWIRIVAGRLGDGYRYSNTIVYNNFVWPEETVEQKKIIEQTARNILNVRSSYPDKSLADLYDPDKMPADLLAAHKANDAAVEAAYGVDFDGDEEKIVAHLFKLYAEKTKEK
ncbi:MAG: class I SAM-dependent DNA methyltransferase [Atopobium sp.]|nr:class I SAM-dependent DNA methyltransferase [Atopobium sp.]